ncbi:hypothetical protein FISHEDRAFT_59874, partial [Fistulina hepatica ATCC 64428]
LVESLYGKQLCGPPSYWCQLTIASDQTAQDGNLSCSSLESTSCTVVFVPSVFPPQLKVQGNMLAAYAYLSLCIWSCPPHHEDFIQHLRSNFLPIDGMNYLATLDDYRSGIVALALQIKGLLAQKDALQSYMSHVESIFSPVGRLLDVVLVLIFLQVPDVDVLSICATHTRDLVLGPAGTPFSDTVGTGFRNSHACIEVLWHFIEILCRRTGAIERVEDLVCRHPAEMSYILDAKIFNPNSSELPLFPQLCKFTVLADLCLDLECGECDERSIANAILSRTDVEGTGVARLGGCTYEVEDASMNRRLSLGQPQ